MPARNEPIATLLVGAEAAAELDGQPWVRPATAEEKQDFIQRVCKGDERKYQNSLVDGNGRPYFLLTILSTAPEAIQASAKSFARCLRLAE